MLSRRKDFAIAAGPRFKKLKLTNFGRDLVLEAVVGEDAVAVGVQLVRPRPV